MHHARNVRRLIGCWCAAAMIFAGVAFHQTTAYAQEDLVLKSQAERVAVVKKVAPTVVAIFAKGGRGGGSGVLISDDGYALTNYHVVRGSGPVMKCGLADGVLYDAVLVGLDKVGDVALIKLYPQKEGEKFLFAPMGDSDLVREGDWSLAMGNPFLLATDFTPTVTFGLVSGVHRYQYPAGTLLEYTDCIQIDTSINPGNSGGPLYNMNGELIGINGRGSFDKRGRVNSGVGYAISINQIKNFLGHMKAGLQTDHASLGATFRTEGEELSQMACDQILTDSDAYRRGLDLDHVLLSFAGRPMTSVNQFKNIIGIFPRGWRMPMQIRAEGQRKQMLVRLMGVLPKEFTDTAKPKPKQPKVRVQPTAKSPVAKYYKPKPPTFVNYYFNQLEQERLLKSFEKHSDFSKKSGEWTLEGSVQLKRSNNESRVKIMIREVKADDGKSVKPKVTLVINEFDYNLFPLDETEIPLLKKPLSSGGFLSAMFIYYQLLTEGKNGFSSGDFYHGGSEPIYPYPQDGQYPDDLTSIREMAEVIRAKLGLHRTKFYFDKKDQKLAAMELWHQEHEDPCEVYFSDYRAVNGRMFPHQLQVVYGDSRYGLFRFTKVNMADGK